jgi:hypothetical protein
MTLTFANPVILLLLAALPVLAVLLMILPRPRRVSVAALKFWIDSRDAPATEQTRRLRRLDAAALLLLAALAMLIAALAGPSIVRPEPAGAALTIIIDRSASLGMTDLDPERTRLDLLRPRIAQLLDSLPPRLPLEIRLLPAHDPHVSHAPATRADDAVDYAAMAAMPADDLDQYSGHAQQARPWLERNLLISPAALDQAHLRQAAQAALDRTDAPVLLVTDISPYAHSSGADGSPATSGVADIDAAPGTITAGQIQMPPGVMLLASGGRGRNAAITRAAVTERQEGLFALAEIALSGAWHDAPARDGHFTVTTDDGRTVATLPLSADHLPATLSLPLPPAAADSRTLLLSLDLADHLPADNRLLLERRDVRRPRIGYVGRRDADLRRLLSLVGGDVHASEQAANLPDGLDLVIFVDEVPQAGFRGAALIVNPPSAVGPIRPTDQQEQPALLGPAGEELAAILPAHMATLRAWRTAALAPGIEPLLEDRRTRRPVAVRYLTPGGPHVVLLADISRQSTDWPDRPSYAVFWSTMIERLTPRAARRTAFLPADPAALETARVLTGAAAESAMIMLEQPPADAHSARRSEPGRSMGQGIDQTAEARRAAIDAERQLRPTLMELWPALVVAALLALAARLYLMK